MNWTEVFAIVTSIIVSFGGASGIVLGFSSWFGKIWANKLMENEKAKHNKEIEELKAELQDNINKSSALNDKYLHVSKSQYDNEYRIYQEIWEVLNDLTISADSLLHNIRDEDIVGTDLITYLNQRIEEYNYLDKRFTKIIDQYAPFYKSDFFHQFYNLKIYGTIISVYYKKYGLNPDNYTENPRQLTEGITANEKLNIINKSGEMMELKYKLIEEIRDYLYSLQLHE